MKRILSSLAISFSALMASSMIAAEPPEYNESPVATTSEQQLSRKHHNYQHKYDEKSLEERRRIREQRGMRRLQHMKWQTGYVMPQHYRSDGYKVEYKEHNLSKPNRNQQWYKINNNYILLDSETKTILQIKNL